MYALEVGTELYDLILKNDLSEIVKELNTSGEHMDLRRLEKCSSNLNIE